jgi:hypothetical protein
MSYYGIHEAKVEYMSCNNCTTEAFAWIAESLPCPKCDSDEYVYPEDVDGMQSISEKDDASICAASSSMWTEIVKKRKRSTRDGRRREYSI